MSDVLLSFNSADREEARALAGKLKSNQLEVFLDERSLIPGQNWLEGIQSAISETKAVVILLGPHGLGRWQRLERDLALDRKASKTNFPVIPVLLPGLEDPPTGFLMLNTWVDFRSNLQPTLAMAGTVTDLSSHLSLLRI